MSYATCRVSGCSNAGVSIDVGGLDVVDDTGKAVSLTVQCGPCGQPIDDVTAQPYPAPASSSSD